MKLKKHKRYNRMNQTNPNNPQEKAKATDAQAPKDDDELEVIDIAPQDEDADSTADTAAELVNDELSKIDALQKQYEESQAALEKEKKEYMFLMAEFDNFRKRTLKEKSEILRNGAESAMKGLLPIIDDFERGIDAIKDTSDAESVKEGMILIYNKFIKYLEQNGVKAMETTGKDFDPDLHEAIAMVPAPTPDDKGKIIDTVSKGYTMNDKVLRHAKVAVAQ